MGITETKKLIDAIKNDILGLMSIDYDLIGMELNELDLEEKKELLVLVGGAVIEILAMVKLGPASTVFSILKKAIS